MTAIGWVIQRLIELWHICMRQWTVTQDETRRGPQTSRRCHTLINTIQTCASWLTELSPVISHQCSVIRNSVQIWTLYLYYEVMKLHHCLTMCAVFAHILKKINLMYDSFNQIMKSQIIGTNVLFNEFPSLVGVSNEVECKQSSKVIRWSLSR